MAKKLANVPWKNIKVGDQCVSHLGTKGKITKKYAPDWGEGYHFENMIDIEWENGKKSFHCFHTLMINIDYIGDDK